MFLQTDSNFAQRGPAADLPAPANPRYLMLDIWRGIACLMIVVLHAAFYFKYDDSPDVRAAAPIAAMMHSIISRFGTHQSHRFENAHRNGLAVILASHQQHLWQSPH